MAGFGYKNPFSGKSFDFGTAFGSNPAVNINDIFDYRNYGGDYDERDRAVGRMAAGSMNLTLTDQQIANLGKGLTSMYGLKDLKNRTSGDLAASTTWESALDNDTVNNFLQTGNVLQATGFGGQNAGSAFGQLAANAQAAHDAGDQNAYGALTNYQNFDLLGNLAQQSMGGIGLDMFNRVNRQARSASETGGDPFGVSGANVFGQGMTSNWIQPQQDTGQGGTASSGVDPNAPTGAPMTPEIPGNASGAPGPVPNQPGAASRSPEPLPPGGSAFGSAGGTMPAGGMGLDDINTRIQALEGAFTEAQGNRPDPAQLNYLTRMANEKGLDAAVNFARNNIIVRAIKASGQTAPKITNSQDVHGASALYDFIMRYVPGAINQPKDEYTRNLLAWYAQNGM